MRNFSNEMMQQGMQEKYCRLGLYLTRGLGSASFWRLLDHFGSAFSVANASSQELLAVPGIGKKNIANIASPASTVASGKKELERVERYGGKVVFIGDKEYPALLAAISDPPPVLFVLGRADVLNRNCIAIVGSRASTSYGRRVSFGLGRELARLQMVVVSGLALGIDGEAHSGALAAEGLTVGVLGCGLDVVYPKQNKDLFRQISETGALITEYPMGTKPEGFRFPARNRIIAGLSRGVVVVEAARRSGSLLTAQMALDQNRDVFAVPGQVDSFKSEGTHWLLKQGAKLVQSAADILEEYPELQSDSCAGSDVEGESGATVLDDEMLALLDLLEPYPMSRDELIARSGLRAETISEKLLFLELEGWIELLPGDEVRKIV